MIYVIPVVYASHEIASVCGTSRVAIDKLVKAGVIVPVAYSAIGPLFLHEAIGMVEAEIDRSERAEVECMQRRLDTIRARLAKQ